MKRIAEDIIVNVPDIGTNYERYNYYYYTFLVLGQYSLPHLKYEISIAKIE
ncbi:MAG: hypothetical protein KAT66_08335 [Candidatus Lokiarchaeota archaeon]|nr:hypothetical protein [Candidatus Lokiarchaeota archaeon]